MGYDALVDGRDNDAIRWLGEATIYQPKLAVYGYDLGIAYQRVGNIKASHSADQRAHELEPSNPDYSKAAEALK